MHAFIILNLVRALKPRTKWYKGVKQYAIDMLDKICQGEIEGVDKFTRVENLRLSHFTGHCDGSMPIKDRSDAAKEIVKRACYGAKFLVSNEDIANRLYTKRDHNCKREYARAMECQVTAVWEALDLIMRFNECMPLDGWA